MQALWLGGHIESGQGMLAGTRGKVILVMNKENMNKEQMKNRVNSSSALTQYNQSFADFAAKLF